MIIPLFVYQQDIRLRIDPTDKMPTLMTSCLAVVLGLACFPHVELVAVSAAEDFISILPRYCKSDCSATELKSATQDDVKRALEANPDIQKEISRLQTESSLIPVPISRCQCSTKCKPQQEILYTCGKCRIVWPFRGIVNTKCAVANSYCPLGCGCPGRCNAYGPRYQQVVLYCPGTIPGDIPFVIKRIKTCTNCCCQYNNYWLSNQITS